MSLTSWAWLPYVSQTHWDFEWPFLAPSLHHENSTSHCSSLTSWVKVLLCFCGGDLWLAFGKALSMIARFFAMVGKADRVELRKVFQ
jgi:hypothetical protein